MASYQDIISIKELLEQIGKFNNYKLNYNFVNTYDYNCLQVNCF